MAAIVTWIESEPVLARVGPAVLLIVGYLLTKGAVDQNTTDLVLGVIGALLGIGGLAGARAAVTPTAASGPGDPPGGRHEQE